MSKILYEEFISSEEYPFLKEQERTIIMNQLKRSMCYYEAWFINKENNIRDECSEVEFGSVYENYTLHTPCIGNWPGFLMNKIPYSERESCDVIDFRL